MDIEQFKASMKKTLDFIPQIGDCLWVSWYDDLPSQHRLLAVEHGYMLLVLVGNKPVRIKSSQANTERPHTSDERFELFWKSQLSETTMLYHWFAENTHRVCLDGVTNGDDLAVAIKRARYEYHTGRNWSEFTGDKTK